MNFWLIKSEPAVFGFSDLQAVAAEPWNGVRNYQARNFLRQMRRGDLCLFYHSNAKPPGVAGVAKVVREAYPDDLQFDPQSPYVDPASTPQNPRWSAVDVAAVAPLPNFLPLAVLREVAELAAMPLLQKGSRLSVMPISQAQFVVTVRLGGLDDLAQQLEAGCG